MPGNQFRRASPVNMSIAEIIAKTRDGIELSAEEIFRLISGYVSEEIPDYQMSAWLMAACIRGLTERETFFLTNAMVASGSTIDLSGVSGIKADKHSTGGVGDKTTLVLIPMLAAAGIKLAKMSGRGLGHTGGTIDKLESIPGFRTELSPNRFLNQVKEIGAAIVTQSADLVPADKKIYALRDVTATVESIPLIASSIMSKKLAAGADIILLDVKYGSGAFMRDKEKALQLANTMFSIGNLAGKKVIAAVSDMNDVLGRAVGNSLEVEEAVQTLNGNGPADLRKLCLELGSLVLVSAGLASDKPSAVSLLAELLDNGKAACKFEEIVKAQEGDAAIFFDSAKLSRAKHQSVFEASESGYISAIDVRQVGLAALELGAGRLKMNDQIDHRAGLIIHKKLGEPVGIGDAIAELFTDNANYSERFDASKNRLKNAYNISRNRPDKSNNNIMTVFGSGNPA